MAAPAQNEPALQTQCSGVSPDGLMCASGSMRSTAITADAPHGQLLKHASCTGSRPCQRSGSTRCHACPPMNGRTTHVIRDRSKALTDAPGHDNEALCQTPPKRSRA